MAKRNPVLDALEIIANRNKELISENALILSENNTLRKNCEIILEKAKAEIQAKENEIKKLQELLSIQSSWNNSESD